MKSKGSAAGLYFTADAVPTPAERAEAAELGITAFRNAKLVDPSRKPEPSALVAGEVPEAYKRIQGQRIAKRK